MDESVLFNGVMQAVLGGRKRKKGRKAMGYLGSAGGALLSNPAALLTAAGVAWGIFETLQGGGQGPTTTSGTGFNTPAAGPSPAAATGAAPSHASLPPLPVMATAAPMTDAAPES